MTHVKFARKPFDRHFNNLVDDLFNEWPILHKTEQKLTGSVPVNITENENAYSIEVVAPGFEKADFKINLDQKLLTIEAEKAVTEKAEGTKQIRKEYAFRSFKRTFTLDEKIDATAIDANYVNGLLTLNLPKKAEVKPAVQSINIQ